MFEKGVNWVQSGGNKRGRPKVGKSMAEFIRSKTRDGQDIAKYYYLVWKDVTKPDDLRMRAAEKLEFRAFGKPAQTIESHIEQAGIVLRINVDPLARPIE